MLIFFLFLNKNICCGYSLEAPRHMYSSRNKKNITWIPPLICSYAYENSVDPDQTAPESDQGLHYLPIHYLKKKLYKAKFSPKNYGLKYSNCRTSIVINFLCDTALLFNETTYSFCPFFFFFLGISSSNSSFIDFLFFLSLSFKPTGNTYTRYKTMYIVYIC